MTYKAEKSTFKLWAPTATKVTLRLYADSTDPKAAQTDAVTLEKSGKKGVWTFAVDKDLKDYAYDYELTFADGTVVHEGDVISLDGSTAMYTSARSQRRRLS